MRLSFSKVHGRRQTLPVLPGKRRFPLAPCQRSAPRRNFLSVIRTVKAILHVRPKPANPKLLYLFDWKSGSLQVRTDVLRSGTLHKCPCSSMCYARWKQLGSKFKREKKPPGGKQDRVRSRLSDFRGHMNKRSESRNHPCLEHLNALCTCIVKLD